ncbi:hypothetical protein H8959_010443 [Pygathrix nigripes]
MLSPGDVVATPAMVAVEPPKTATLNAEVPGTVGAVPGALEEECGGHYGVWAAPCPPLDPPWQLTWNRGQRKGEAMVPGRDRDTPVLSFQEALEGHCWGRGTVLGSMGRKVLRLRGNQP